MFAIRNLVTEAYWGSDSWSDDPDLVSRFDSLEEAETAAQSISEDGFVVIVQMELQIVETDLLGLVETQEVIP